MTRIVKILLMLHMLIPGLLSASDISGLVKYVPRNNNEDIMAAGIKGGPAFGFLDQIKVKKMVKDALIQSGGKNARNEIKKMTAEFNRSYESARQVSNNFFHEAAIFIYPGVNKGEVNAASMQRYLVIASLNIDWKPRTRDQVTEGVNSLQMMLKNVRSDNPSPFMNGAAIRYGDVFVIGDQGTVSAFIENKKNGSTDESGDLDRISAGIRASALYTFWSSENPEGVYPLFNNPLSGGVGQDAEMKKGFLEIMNSYSDDGTAYTVEDADRFYKGLRRLEQRVYLKNGIDLQGTINGTGDSYTPIIEKMFEDQNYLVNAFSVINRKYGLSINPEDFDYSGNVQQDESGYTVNSRIKIKAETVTRLLSPVITGLLTLQGGGRSNIPDRKGSGRTEEEVKKEETQIETGWVDENTYRVESSAGTISGIKNRVVLKEKTKQNAIKAAKEKILEDFRTQRMNSVILYSRSSEGNIKEEFGKTADGGSVIKVKYKKDGSCEIIYQVTDKGLKKKVTGQ